MCVLSHFSRVWLFETLSRDPTLETVAHQAPLSMGFSRQEYWSGLPCCPPEDLPDPGIKLPFLTSPAFADRLFTTTSPWVAHLVTFYWMPDIVNFTMLGTRHCFIKQANLNRDHFHLVHLKLEMKKCITFKLCTHLAHPLSILSSQVTVTYFYKIFSAVFLRCGSVIWQQFHPFMALLYILLSVTREIFSLVLIFFTNEAVPFSVFLLMLHVLWEFSALAASNAVWTLSNIPFSSLGFLFPQSWWFPHTQAGVSKWDTCESPCADSQNSLLFSSLLSGTLPYKHKPPWLSQTPRSVSSTQGAYLAWPDFPISPIDWKLSPGGKLERGLRQFIHFPSLRDYCPLLKVKVLVALLLPLLSRFSRVRPCATP